MSTISSFWPQIRIAAHGAILQTFRQHFATEPLEPWADARVHDRRSRVSARSSSMRASHFAALAAALAIPTIGYAQNDGPVGGRVGPDLSTSPTRPGPSTGAPYATPSQPSATAGYSGSIAPGQFVPQNVTITPRPGGAGSAYIDGHRVLVDPNTNRILRVFN
jgi:hypothetical protein